MRKDNIHLTEFEFFESLFYKEQERSKYYDSIIQFPTTIIVILIGGALYSINDFYKNVSLSDWIWIDWTYSILCLLLAASICITIFLLFNVFHGFTRKYYYLPYSEELAQREIQLFEFVNNNKKAYNVDSEEEIRDLARNLFENDIVNYYKDGSNVNQIINDHRASRYAQARNFLFVNILVFLLIGILGLIF